MVRGRPAAASPEQGSRWPVTGNPAWTYATSPGHMGACRPEDRHRRTTMPHEFVQATTLARRLALGVAATSLLALRSEEHTSELQSPCNLVCRLLLEIKK